MPPKDASHGGEGSSGTVALTPHSCVGKSGATATSGRQIRRDDPCASIGRIVSEFGAFTLLQLANNWKVSSPVAVYCLTVSL